MLLIFNIRLPRGDDCQRAAGRPATGSTRHTNSRASLESCKDGLQRGGSRQGVGLRLATRETGQGPGGVRLENQPREVQKSNSVQVLPAATAHRHPILTGAAPPAQTSQALRPREPRAQAPPPPARRGSDWRSRRGGRVRREWDCSRAGGARVA